MSRTEEMTGRKEFRSQMQESEQQLENLVRELKAAPANHIPVQILLANHVTARRRIKSSSLRTSENSSQRQPNTPVCILLANHVTARCRNSEQQLEDL
jgi:hypothetical protein